MYFKHRFLAFLAAHGKFGFDYLPVLMAGEIFIQIYKIYENKNAS